MLPTLNSSGDLLLTSKLHKWGRFAERGDIITLKSPLDRKSNLSKRLIGLPGDIIDSGAGYIKVPPGHAWVVGDNLAHSLDSRTFGPVPLALLRGKIICRLWPEFTLFNKNKVTE